MTAAFARRWPAPPLSPQAAAKAAESVRSTTDAAQALVDLM